MTLKERCREYYETHRITFDKLSKLTLTLFGEEVSHDVLRQWSSDDGGWKKADITHKDKLEFLASIVYDRIEDSHEKLTVNELTTLINTYRDLIIKAVPPNEVKANRPVLQDIITAVKDEVGSDTDDSE